jgi:hypothetical protein
MRTEQEQQLAASDRRADIRSAGQYADRKQRRDEVEGAEDRT